MAKTKPPAAPVKPARSARAKPATKRSATVKPGKPAPKPRAIQTKVSVAALPDKQRTKLERGRFTLPLADFERIAELKTRARDLGRPTRKNELFRVGLALLSALSDESLVIALDQLEPVGKKARSRRPKSDLDNRDS
jgi:hypothetical protein